MLFRNEHESLKLDIFNYELGEDEGDPTGDDRNWLVMRATWVKWDGDIVKDSNSCLLTHELQSLTAGLKVLRAGIRDLYLSDFQENCFFSLAAQAVGEASYEVKVSFYMPNTMDGDGMAELTCPMNGDELTALIEELEKLCEKFPDRT